MVLFIKRSPCKHQFYVGLFFFVRVRFYAVAACGHRRTTSRRSFSVHSHHIVCKRLQNAAKLNTLICAQPGELKLPQPLRTLFDDFFFLHSDFTSTTLYMNSVVYTYVFFSVYCMQTAWSRRTLINACERLRLMKLTSLTFFSRFASNIYIRTGRSRANNTGYNYNWLNVFLLDKY